MAKDYTESFQRTINSVAADESPIILIEITRDDLATPIRIANYTANVVHQSNTFIACPFRVGLPDSPEEGLPRATLSIDNVGKVLTQWVDNADWTVPTYCKLIQIMPSDPDTEEWSITMEMTDISMNSLEVSARLGMEDLLGSPAITVKYNPVVAPGLF